MLEGSSALRTGIGIQEPGTGTGEPLEGSSALRRGIGIREPRTGTGEPLKGSSALRRGIGIREPGTGTGEPLGGFSALRTGITMFTGVEVAATTVAVGGFENARPASSTLMLMESGAPDTRPPMCRPLACWHNSTNVSDETRNYRLST